MISFFFTVSWGCIAHPFPLFHIDTVGDPVVGPCQDGGDNSFLAINSTSSQFITRDCLVQGYNNVQSDSALYHTTSSLDSSDSGLRSWPISGFLLNHFALPENGVKNTDVFVDTSFLGSFDDSGSLLNFSGSSIFEPFVPSPFGLEPVYNLPRSDSLDVSGFGCTSSTFDWEKSGVLSHLGGASALLISTLAFPSLGPLFLFHRAFALNPVYVSPSGSDSGTCGGSGDRCETIARAVSNADATATIYLGDGTYNEFNIGFAGKEIVLKGESGVREAVVVDAGGQGRVFNVGSQTQPVSFESLTITGGNATGTGLAGYGGGIYASYGATVNVTNTILSSNSATGPGGGICSWIEVTLSVINTTLSSNSANNGGGIYSWTRGTLNVFDTTITSNWAGGNGGGICAGVDTPVSVINTILSSNSANTGGGIYANTPANVYNTTLTSNLATWDGGGIYAGGTNVNVTNAIFSNNSATRNGGGISAVGANVILDKTSFYGNTASNGGCLYKVTASVTITRSLCCSDNQAPTSPALFEAGGLQCCEGGGSWDAIAWNCSFCSPGTNQSVPFSPNSCPTCPIDTYSATSGSLLCTPCEPGFYTVDSNLPSLHDESSDCVQAACVAGSYGLFPSCVVCDPDTYSTAVNASSNSTCQPCPSHSHTVGGDPAKHDSLDDCLCDAGWGGGNGVCDVLCLPGTFSNSNGVCQVCGSGMFQNASGQGFCFTCPGTSYTTGNSAGDHDELIDCLCQAGWEPMGVCARQCEMGTYQNGTMPACAVCPSTSYQDAVGEGSCNPCDVFLPNSETPGTIASEANASSDCRCKEGLWNNAGSCLSVPAGEYSPPATNEKFICPPNTVQPADGMGSCEPCPNGGVTSGNAGSDHDDFADCRAPLALTCEKDACGVCDGKNDCLSISPGIPGVFLPLMAIVMGLAVFFALRRSTKVHKNAKAWN